MYYAILHYEKNNEIHEFTLREPSRALLKHSIIKVQAKIRDLGRCRVFYATAKNIESFRYNVFRFGQFDDDMIF